MQFGKDMVDAILEGRKTRTTRPVTRAVIPQPPEYVGAPEYMLCACKYHIGRTYAICPGRGKRGVARIRVTDVRFYEGGIFGIPHSEQHEHARREGFSSWFQFTSTWDELYQYAAAKHYGPVWVIDFELVKETGDANTDAAS